MRLALTALFLLCLSSLPPAARAQGLNQEMGIPLWADSSLWDDTLPNVVERLRIPPDTAKREGVIQLYFDEESRVFGARAYTLQIYHDGKFPTGIVIAFANKPDMAFFMKQKSGGGELSGSQLVELETRFASQLKEDRAAIRTSLSGRIGQPRQASGNGEQWLWLGHDIRIEETGESLILRIEPVQRAGGGDQVSRTRPTDRIERNSTGDVLLTGVPAISQGARNYCVPASWEKALKYHGIRDINVYDLAKTGGTTVDGSQFTPFAAKVAPLLKERGLEVQFVKGHAGQLATVQSHIDRGTPLIWALNAASLPAWARRSGERGVRLPEGDIPPAGEEVPHALLVIGYNAGNQEIALSDSTEMGANVNPIWIRFSEAKAASLPLEKEMVVLTKVGEGASKSGPAPLPFKNKRYY